jgi:hypothetical protein
MQASWQDALKGADYKRSDLFSTEDKGHTLLMLAAQKNANRSLRQLLSDPLAPIDAQHEKVRLVSLSLSLC